MQTTADNVCMMQYYIIQGLFRILLQSYLLNLLGLT